MASINHNIATAKALGANFLIISNEILGATNEGNLEGISATKLTECSLAHIKYATKDHIINAINKFGILGCIFFTIIAISNVIAHISNE